MTPGSLSLVFEATSMAFYYFDATGVRVGPCSMDQLRRFHAEGLIALNTRISMDATEATIAFEDLWAQLDPESRVVSPMSVRVPASDPERAAEAGAGPERGDPGASGVPGAATAPPPLPTPPTPASSVSAGPKDAASFTRRAGEDLRVMLPHLTLPLDELRNFQWLQERRALAIAGVGLLPLAIYAAFREPWQLGNAYWAMALYFSTLWALFFYYAFPTPEVEVRTAALCFFTTGLVSVSTLYFAYRVWPLTDVMAMITSENWVLAWTGFILGVGLPEEVCKALVLFIIVWQRNTIRPQTLLFYGLMSGLGFGIYEGVKYQTHQNFEFAIRTAAGNSSTHFAAEYYLLNLVRLTTLPFLHAIWTGMAGYFIGFAIQFPQRHRGLILVAIGLPTVLHGAYNAMNEYLAVGMVIALISVLALNLYLAKSVEFERLLNDRKPPAS